MNGFEVGDLVKVKLGQNVVTDKAEVLQLPVWANDMWVLKNLVNGKPLQVSACRATIIKLI